MAKHLGFERLKDISLLLIGMRSCTSQNLPVDPSSTLDPKKTFHQFLYQLRNIRTRQTSHSTQQINELSLHTLSSWEPQARGADSLG